LTLKAEIKMLSFGFEHCIALLNNGKVASWGCGASGCLGHGDYLSYSVPNIIVTGDFIDPNINIKFIECGGYHSSAIDSKG